MTQAFVLKGPSGLCLLLPFPAGEFTVVASYILSLGEL